MPNEPVARIYHSPADLVFEMSMKAAMSLGSRIDNVDKQARLLSFHTGLSWRSWAGQDMSLIVFAKGTSEAEVNVTGVRRQQGMTGQLYDWGEAKSIANKLLDKLENLLKVSQV